MRSNSVRAGRGLVLLALVLVPLVAGCSGMEKIHERSWLGGSYSNLHTWRLSGWPWDGDLMPDEIAERRTRAVLVREVYEGTPAAAAGLEPGDVILAAGGAEVRTVDDLWEQLDEWSPGEELDVTVSRFGSVETRPVTLGTERYRRAGYFSIGLGFGSRLVLDWWPTPDFNLLGVMSYRSSSDRLELRAPHMRVRQWVADGIAQKQAAEAGTPAAASGADPIADATDEEPYEEGVTSREGWHFQLAIFGVSKRHRILSQEL